MLRCERRGIRLPLRTVLPLNLASGFGHGHDGVNPQSDAVDHDAPRQLERHPHRMLSERDATTGDHCALKDQVITSESLVSYQF